MTNAQESTKSNPNKYLHALTRIDSPFDANKHSGDVFLLPHDIDFNFRSEDNLIETVGLGKYDAKVRDLIRVIKIDDALNIKYQDTNILTPLMYAEQLQDIPWHITTQGILFVRVDQDAIDWIKQTISKKLYGKHDADSFWLPFSRSINEIVPGDVLCIFNRRVAGWDGSHERPVIELLGAGGHLPHVWDSTDELFRPLSIVENVAKELHEELGLKISEDSITTFGGYENTITHELVILCGIEIATEHLQSIQDYAIQNIDEDTQGIYLGTFKEVIDYYRKNPKPFAGGVRTAPYNFPNHKELMIRAFEYSRL